MAHTPRPWRVGISIDNGIHCVDAIVAGQTVEICEVWGVCDDTIESPESHANARLIAAAPDLLDACERIMPTLDSMIAHGIRWDPDQVEAVRAAIAAARDAA